MDKLLTQYVVDEYRFVASKMASTPNERDALYFFSAAYAAPQRVLNISFSREMLMLHAMTHWTYTMLNSNISAQQAGQPARAVPPETFQNLGEVIGEIADRLSKDEDLTDLYERMCELGYVASGNGLYLHHEGKL